MNRYAAILLCLVSRAAVAAEPDDAFPTHCRPGEFAYLNAKMATLEWRDNAAPGTPAVIFHKNGKVLSLCADRKGEPLAKLVYRYGALGKIEFEKTATPEDKFLISYQQDGPHGGENVFFFHSGVHTYYVTEAVGDGHGIAIHVFKEGNRVAYLFSGTDRYTDYVSGLFPISFEESRSPIFSQMDPEHAIGKLR